MLELVGQLAMFKVIESPRRVIQNLLRTNTDCQTFGDSDRPACSTLTSACLSNWLDRDMSLDVPQLRTSERKVHSSLFSPIGEQTVRSLQPKEREQKSL